MFFFLNLFIFCLHVGYSDMNMRIHFYIERASSGRKSDATYPVDLEDVNRKLEPLKRAAEKAFEEFKTTDPVYQGAKKARDSKALKRAERLISGQSIHLSLEAAKRKKAKPEFTGGVI